MGFLAPALLVLGVAVVVPLVLHLLHRHQGPRVDFPALRYLRRAEREHAREIRLRQLLLLAFRILVLGLIALAAARPFLRSGSSMHEPTAVVLVLDNSLSTGLVQGETRVLDRLVDRAQQTLAAAGPDDRFWLLTAASGDPALAGSPAQLSARLDEAEVVAGAADLGDALRRALALLDAGAEGRAAEIHLLTDLQASGFSEPVEVPPDVVLAVWAPDGTVANRAVTAVEVGGGLAPRAGERSSVAARVDGPPGDSTELRLVVDDQVRAVAVAPTGATTLLPLPGQDAGVLHGRVEVDADALRGDDRRYFAVEVLPPPTVAVAGTAPFVEAAVAVLLDGGRVRTAPAATADVVFAPGGTGMEGIREGGAVVVLPPSNATELPALNQRLAARGVAWRYTARRVPGEARLDVADAVAELSTLGQARIRQAYRLEPRDPGPRDTVLLRLADGDPWLVRGRVPGARWYLLLASPLVPEASTIPVSTAMLPLLDHLTGVWSEVAQATPSVEPGTDVPLPGRARSVQQPDGRRLAVEGGAPFRAPPRAGVYTVWAADTLLTAFAVNAPAAESVLRRVPADRVLAGPGLRVVDRGGAWTDAIYHRRRGAELGGLLLALVLALLIVESLVAATGRGTRGAEPDAGETAPGRNG